MRVYIYMHQAGSIVCVDTASGLNSINIIVCSWMHALDANDVVKIGTNWFNL